MANNYNQNGMGRVEKYLQDVLRIRKLPLDPLAKVALRETREKYKIDEEEFLTYVRRKGLWTSIMKVAKEFVSLSDMRRRILAATFSHTVKGQRPLT